MYSVAKKNKFWESDTQGLPIQYNVKLVKIRHSAFNEKQFPQYALCNSGTE
jgi:hypothetical protein